jgi:hypothetical protein
MQEEAFAKALEDYLLEKSTSYSGMCYFASLAFSTYASRFDRVVESQCLYLLHGVCVEGDDVIDFTAKQFDPRACSVFRKKKDEYIYWINGCLADRGIYFPVTKWDKLQSSGKIIPSPAWEWIKDDQEIKSIDSFLKRL